MSKTDLSNSIDQLISQQQLPDHYHLLVEQYLEPLSAQIAAAYHVKQAPLVLGINGAQGTGKSTLCLFLKLLLKAQHELRCVVLSIDDFYLNRDRRQQLAASVHPLFATRGVPGTHDVLLALATLRGLMAGQIVAVPQFSKADDDVLPPSSWPVQQSPVDIILFEGWCVGAIAQPSEALLEPVNQLEKEQDSEGLWRNEVNQRLGKEYQQWFSLIDQLIMLAPPSMDAVLQWRSLQEQRLAKKTASANAKHLMSDKQIRRFIQHFERLSVYMMAEMPKRADTVMTLDQEHRIVSTSGLQRAGK